MLIIFGWLKEKKAGKFSLKCHCLNCQYKTEWFEAVLQEWVTFFGVRTYAFINKSSLVCESCGDELMLDKKACRMLRRTATADETTLVWIRGGFEQLIDGMQMARKTPRQREYIEALRDADRAREARQENATQ